MAQKAQGQAPQGALAAGLRHPEDIEGFNTTGHRSACIPPRVQDSCTNLTKPRPHDASVGLQLRLPQQTTTRVVQWLSMPLWERDLAGLPSFPLQKWWWPEWEAEGTNPGGWRHSALRAAWGIRTTMAEDNPSEKISYTLSGSSTVNDCSQTSESPGGGSIHRTKTRSLRSCAPLSTS